MTDVIGRGVIEASVDAKGIKAGIEDAKRSIRSLGGATSEASKRASDSIDRYVKRLEMQAATTGKTARETELYKLSLRGASKEQLAAADSALKMVAGYERGAAIGARMRTAFIGLAAAAGAGLIAATIAFDKLIKKAGDFQDIAEKTGDTAVNIASLAVAAGTANTSMETITAASERLTKGLTGVDDESKAAGAAVTALGLDLKTFKDLKAADQFEVVAKALAGFEDGAEKTAVAMALFGKSGAELLPFLKELGQEGGRQNILTAEQIRLADEYSDKQGKLRAEISLHAQAIASDMLPALNDFTATIAQLAKDQDFAATASDLLKGALAGAVVVFQTIAIVASDVGFVFKGVGREIGAIAAQLAALARLDFAGFSAISDAVREDAIRARAELDRFQAAILNIGNGTSIASGKTTGDFARMDRAGTRPRLKFSGAATKDKSGASTAAQEAKAQLAFDLEQIKKASDALINTYGNAENIMQAQRAAGLVDERDYYAAKLALINLNAQAQDDALGQQIERVKAEKLAGKDKIEADRKILDLESQRAKVRENAVASIEVLGIQERSSIAKSTQAYQDATIAAREYLDTLAKRNARELEGMGKGEKFRERQSGLNELEDGFLKEKQRLERDRRNKQITESEFAQYLQVARETYAAEVDLFNQRTIAMEAKQGDWVNGFTESLNNYIDKARDVAGQTKDLFDNAFKGLEDSLTSFISTGKGGFKELLNSISSDITRMSVRQVLEQGMEALKGSDLFGSLFKSIGGSAAGSGAAGAAAAAATAQTAAQTAAVTANTVALTSSTASASALSAAEVAASSAIAAASASSAAALAALATAASSAAAALAAVSGSSAANGVGSIFSLFGGGNAGGTIASDEGLALFFGDKGGYTGDVGVDQVAGVVHGKEYVFSAPAVKSIGLETLEQMHRKGVSGGRAIGGPVSAASLIEVNERGRPELLEMAGKQYLLTGQRGGQVKDAAAALSAAGGDTYIVQVTATPGMSREQAMNQGRDIQRGMQIQAGRRARNT